MRRSHHGGEVDESLTGLITNGMKPRTNMSAQHYEHRREKKARKRKNREFAGERSNNRKGKADLEEKVLRS